MLKDISNNIEREVSILFQHLCIIGRLFAAGICIQMAADGLDFLDYVQRIPSNGTLERHMFQKMGNAIDIRRFISCAGTDPNTAGNSLDLRHLFSDDAHSVGQG